MNIDNFVSWLTLGSWVVSGIAYLIRLVRGEANIPKWLSLKTIIGITIAVGFSLSVFSLYLNYHQPIKKVAAPFRSAYVYYAPQLGKPGAVAKNVDAVQSVYEHAIIIWLRSNLTIYVLPTDAPDQKLRAQQDPVWDSDPRFYDEDELRRMFPDCCPRDRLPPWGGIARHWKDSPKDWEWIGWRKSQCLYHASAILKPNV